MTTVAIVVLATVLMPVLEDYQDDSTITYTNAGTKSKLVDSSTAIVFDGTTLTVGGNTFSGGRVALMTDGGILHYNASGTTLNLNTNGTLYSGLTSLNVTADPSTKTVSGTYTNSTHTEATSVSFTWSDWAVCYDPSGEYVTNYYTSSSVFTPVYYTDINDVYGANSVNASTYIAWHGTTVGGSAEGTATLDQKDISGVSDAHYFNTRYNESGLSYVDGDTTYYPPFICAKATVSVLNDNDDRYVQLLSVIPVLVIVAIIMGVVFAVISRRE